MGGYLSENEFIKFIERHKRVIIKPKESACGEGIRLLDFCNSLNKEIIYNEYQNLKGHDILIEECIENEPLVKAFHPSSLNTVRIVTVKTHSGVEILGSFIRFGRSNNIVDNGGQNGLLAMVDCTTGTIMTDAFDKMGNSFQRHPDSNIPFIGFKIPGFKDMITVVTKAALINPQVKVIGWDVVKKSNGEIDIVEGNHRPDAYGLQMPIDKGYKTKLYKMIKI